jgi:hypothetical protein
LASALAAQKTIELLPFNTCSWRSFNTQPQIVGSKDDQAIVAWLSGREGVAFKNIYAQKLGPDGKFLWEGDGTPVCPVQANQDNFTMADDHFGGAVIVWEDYRQGPDQPRIYAQRLNFFGEPMWGHEGVRICTRETEQRKPRVVFDSKTGFYILWEDGRNGEEQSDIFGQYINLSGHTNWMMDGLPIVTAKGLQKNIVLASDEDQHLYILWEDFRNGRYWNLFAQKVDRKGDYFWSPGGLDIFAGREENQESADMVPDGYGGLLFVYQRFSDESRGYDIYRGRINSAGELNYNFATCYSAENQINPKIAKKGSYSVVTWEDERNGNWDVYAHMFTISNGLLTWQVNGAPVAATSHDERRPSLIASTQYNHQIITWEEREGENTRIYAQILDNYGGPVWEAAEPVTVQSQGNQGENSIVEGEESGFWAVWSDDSKSEERPVLAQRLTVQRKRFKNPEGVRLTGNHVAPAKIANPQLLAARTGDFFLVWEDYRNGTGNSDIYLQKLNAKGEELWRHGGIPVCAFSGEQSRPVMVEDGVGGVIVAWVDARKGEDDIYAQRISETGKSKWVLNGTVVCQAPRSQSGLRAVTDGREGVVLLWVDARNILTTGFDLYIQRMNEVGEPLWGVNGKTFTPLEGMQTSPSLAPDGEGGAFVTWMDNRSGVSNISAQHLNSYGIAEWEEEGRALAAKDQPQRSPEILLNFMKDLYVAWEDARFGEGFEKIYVQRLTPGGSQVWGFGGRIVCQMVGSQTKPRIAQDVYGDLWVTWLDGRSFIKGRLKLMCQRLTLDGVPKWDASAATLGDGLTYNNDYSMVTDKNGHSYFVWNQTELNEHKHAYFQHLDPSGMKQLGLDGLFLGSDDHQQFAPVMAINGDQQVLVCWVEFDPATGRYGLSCLVP